MLSAADNSGRVFHHTQTLEEPEIGLNTPLFLLGSTHPLRSLTAHYRLDVGGFLISSAFGRVSQSGSLGKNWNPNGSGLDLFCARWKRMDLSDTNR